MTAPLVQNCSSPSLQYAHSPQESTMQPTPTRSPTLYRVTPDPTAETTPAISWPGTIGKMAGPHSSRTWWMSLWQMPANLTSISTSSSRSSRVSIVVACRGAPAEAADRAAVRDMWCLLHGSRLVTVRGQVTTWRLYSVQPPDSDVRHTRVRGSSPAPR